MRKTTIPALLLHLQARSTSVDGQVMMPIWVVAGRAIVVVRVTEALHDLFEDHVSGLYDKYSSCAGIWFGLSLTPMSDTFNTTKGVHRILCVFVSLRSCAQYSALQNGQQDWIKSWLFSLGATTSQAMAFETHTTCSAGLKWGHMCVCVLWWVICWTFDSPQTSNTVLLSRGAETKCPPHLH